MNDENKSNPKHPLLDTIILACVLGALFSMYGMATGLIFVAIPMTFWLPYSLFVIVRHSERRRVQLLKIVIWFLMVASVLTVHLVRRHYARNYADSVVQKIGHFKNSQGRYPDSLKEIGISPAEFKEKLGMSNYSNRPSFYYGNTMVVFHLWSYDFAKCKWVDEYD